MNDFPIDLRNFLISNDSENSFLTTLYSLIGTRLYYASVEQDAGLPNAAYEVGVEVPIPTFDGVSGITEAIIQFYIGARDVPTLRSIGSSLVGALNQFQGQMGTSDVALISYLGDNQDYDVETGVYYMTLKFKLTNNYA